MKQMHCRRNRSNAKRMTGQKLALEQENRMEILQEIIKMDKAAATRTEKAVEEERRLSDESGESTAKAREKLVAEERGKVEKFCREQEAKLSERLSQAEKIRGEQCEKLDESFNAHRAAWKSEIIGRITGC